MRTTQLLTHHSGGLAHKKISSWIGRQTHFFAIQKTSSFPGHALASNYCRRRNPSVSQRHKAVLAWILCLLANFANVPLLISSYTHPNLPLSPPPPSALFVLFLELLALGLPTTVD